MTTEVKQNMTDTTQGHHMKMTNRILHSNQSKSKPRRTTVFKNQNETHPTSDIRLIRINTTPTSSIEPAVDIFETKDPPCTKRA